MCETSCLNNMLKFLSKRSFVETEAILRYKNYRTAVDDIWYFLDLYTSFNDIAT